MKSYPESSQRSLDISLMLELDKTEVKGRYQHLICKLNVSLLLASASDLDVLLSLLKSITPAIHLTRLPTKTGVFHLYSIVKPVYGDHEPSYRMYTNIYRGGKVDSHAPIPDLTKWTSSLKNKIHQMRNVSLAGSQGRGYQVY
jgi:hypothetical protein